ncbi:hypothetical protein [Hallella bergensis]
MAVGLGLPDDAVEPLAHDEQMLNATGGECGLGIIIGFRSKTWRKKS